MVLSLTRLIKLINTETSGCPISKNLTTKHSIGMLCLCVTLFLCPVFGFAQEEQQLEEAKEKQQEYATELNLDDLRRRIYNEAPSELMSLKLGDTEVSLFITGSWKGELQLNPGYFFSQRGSGFTASDTPLFMQEADLTLSLWIDRWFVEANFLDDSSQNTYRAGYQGRPGEFLQYAGIGNTGLDFPVFAYMDLGGDSPSSFGFYSRFGNEVINFHTLFRYDSSAREERTFLGTRERTFSYVQPQDAVRGISFILPDTDIDSQITVYIEDEKGDIRDTGGRRWRQALSSEYAASRSLGLLELSVRPQGMAAVSYSKNGARPWNVSMGSYDGSQNGFLTIIQNWFSSSGKTIKLENYPQAGNKSSTGARPGEVFFNEGAALVIFENGAFSPFERRSRYDAPSSDSEQAVILRQSSGTEVEGYQLVLYETGFDSIDFFTLTSGESQRNIYELIIEGGFSKREPQTLFPLAGEYPEIYLPGSGNHSTDIVLRFTNYNNANGYFVGTDVVPDSVQVWRSGIQDSNFDYNASSGEVIIYGHIGQNELIRVTYLKRSEETRFGSIAAGVGAVYKKTDNFSAQAALGFRFNVSEDSYTEDNYSSMGNAAFSAKAAWDYDSLKAYASGGFALEQADTTGLYRAAGMEGHETILYLPHENSFLSNPHFSEYLSNLTTDNRTGLIYRNYYSNSVLGANVLPIDANIPVVTGVNRPYSAKDPQLGNANVLTAEFNLEGGEWTGFQSPLNNVSDLLSRAGEIEIPFRFFGFNENLPVNFKVVIQIGSLSGKDFAFAENPALIWEKILYADDMSVTDPDSYYSSSGFNQNARIARFKLSEEDRKKLGDAKFLRLVAVNDGGKNVTGRVLLANPIVRGAAFRPVVYDSIVNGNSDKVRAIETVDTGSLLEKAYPEIIDRFHKTRSQRVLRIDWENMDAGFSAGVDGQLDEMPLSDYRELSFFIKINNEQLTMNKENLRLVISDGAESIDNNQMLDAQIPLNVFRAEKWQKVTIRYQGNNKGISVDGLKAENAFFNYRQERVLFDSSERKTSYIIFLFNPQDSSSTLQDGTVFIDEVILEDSCFNYRMNFGAGIDYKKNGSILSFGKVDVLSDFSVSTALESEARAGIEINDDALYGSVVSRTGMGISLFGIQLKGNMSFTAAENLFLWSADHSLSRTIGAFSLNEAFYASPFENTARHTFKMSFMSDFNAAFDADAFYDLSKLKQNWKFDIGYKPKNQYIPSLALNTQILWTKKNKIEEENYGEIWINSWEHLIPDSGQGAETRKTSAQIVLTERTKPVGAVITVNGSALFSDAGGSAGNFTASTRLENSAFLDVPVVTDKINVNFRAGRSFRQQLNHSGDDVFDDGRLFLDSVDDSFVFWKVIPFYSLFAPELNDTMDRGVSDSKHSSLLNYTSFNDHFSVRINLLSVYSAASFFFPTKINFRLERVMEQKMDTRADILNAGGSLGFSSINMFGNLGYLPIFKFYRSDEFSHTVDAAFVIPKENEISWRIQSAAGANFRMLSDMGNIKFTNTFTMRNDESWLESFSALWEAPAPKSLIGLLYNRIYGLMQKQSSWLNLQSGLLSKYEQLRRESIEMVYDKTGDYPRWSLTAGHEEIVRITGRLNLTGFIKLKFSENLYTEIFTIEALLGTSLKVSF